MTKWRDLQFVLSTNFESSPDLRLTLTRTHAALLLAALAGTAVAVFPINTRIHAQTQPQAPVSAPAPAPQVPQPPARPLPQPQPARAVIVLDPAHGGPDSGATLADHVIEKDVTLAFADRLRAALTSAGFTVIATRDADAPGLLTPDQRAATANRTHAVACLVLHATAVGSGVHLYTSTLPWSSPAPDADADSPAPFVPIPWESAQAGFVDQSRHLADDLKAALAKSAVPTLAGQAPLRPLDNLMCPAVAIEIAPSAASGSSTPASDADYQQRVAASLTAALQAWRTQAAAAAAQAGAPQ